MTGFLTGKRALIVGILNNRSIAYGIAKSMHQQGAELAFTYVNDQLKERVQNVATEFGSKILLPCDVSSDEQIHDLFKSLKTHWDQFDILVHSVAFAPADQLVGNYLDSVTREGFKISHDISSYSFAALGKEAYPMMEARNGAMVALTYLGSTRAMPNYNVMGLAKASLEANVRYMAHSLGPKGIRVNALSAGPVKTLAASGVSGFRKMLAHYEAVSPLRRNVTLEQVGDAAAFLCSDLAGGITGEILHVDSGFHAVAMGDLEG
jgi:enoyl-[acyl-carrier protein] reductase I